jgi:hypothetical protein
MMQKARKLHTCDSCGRPIQPNDLYRRVKGRYEGDFYSSAYHTPCAAQNQVLWDEHGSDMCYTDARDAAREEARNGGWKDFRRKVRAAVRSMLDYHEHEKAQRAKYRRGAKSKKTDGVSTSSAGVSQ